MPLAFPSQEVNGQSYVDGGLADNLPLRALAKRSCHLNQDLRNWHKAIATFST